MTGTPMEAGAHEKPPAPIRHYRPKAPYGVQADRMRQDGNAARSSRAASTEHEQRRSTIETASDQVELTPITGGRMKCKYAAAADGRNIPDGLTSQEIGRLFAVGGRTVRRHRAGDCICATEEAAPVDFGGGTVDVGPEGGEFRDIKTAAPLTDWDHIFEKFGLDPSTFMIEGDSVRMSMWQTSRRTDDGDRDIVNLYSYRAMFKRKPQAAITESDIADFTRAARTWKLPTTPPQGNGTPVAAVLNLADMQLMKGEGGGLQPTLDRLSAALESFQRQIRSARASGLNINELVIVNNGDPFEGIAGNYANQAHTVQGGLRAQMNAVLDVWLMFARTLYPLFEKRQFVTVLCNHTQFGRQGGAKDSITGEEDNGSAFLAETLMRILNSTPGLDNVKFTIPHDEMNVYTDIANVPTGFNHGHKVPGNGADGFEKWLNGQVRSDRKAHDARVWITAHRHNFQMFDIGSATVLQCPSCDGGSKWLTDTSGKHSNSGVVSILIGEHHRLGWSDVAFL